MTHASRHRDRFRLAAPSSEGTDSAVCRRSRQTASRRNSRHRARFGTAPPYAARRSVSSARRENDSSPGLTSGAEGSSPATKNASSEPDSFSMRLRTSMSATRSAPRIQRCTIGSICAGARAGENSRTKAAGLRPHRGKQRLDRLQHARHATKREPRRAEPDDLPVFRRFESPDDMNGIGG